MHDAHGGLVNITIITIFIVITLSYLAFNVNYTKAFRMKNKIIDVYNEYNGVCEAECENKIISYATTIGYKPDSLMCAEPDMKKRPKTGTKYYCIAEKRVKNNSSKEKLFGSDKVKYHYLISTKINMSFPIIDNVLGISWFTVSGNTKTFEKYK